MVKYCFGICLFILSIISLTKAAGPDSVDPASAMRWRQIGPSRAGRARAAVGSSSQPNVFYIGFDDGGKITGVTFPSMGQE